jgi:hypothetical protein
MSANATTSEIASRPPAQVIDGAIAGVEREHLMATLGRRDGEVAEAATEIEDFAFEVRQCPFLEGIQPVFGGVDLPVELLREEVDRLVAHPEAGFTASIVAATT